MAEEEDKKPEADVEVDLADDRDATADAADAADDKKAKDAPKSKGKGKGKTKKKGGGSKRMMIIGGIVALVLLGGGGGAAFFLLGSSEPEIGPPVYVELPQLTVDLADSKRRTTFVRLTLILQIPENYQIQFKALEPKALDSIQSLLRGKTRETLAGQQGTENLRNEIRGAVTDAIKPVPLMDILFKDIIVQ